MARILYLTQIDIDFGVVRLLPPTNAGAKNGPRRSQLLGCRQMPPFQLPLPLTDPIVIFETPVAQRYDKALSLLGLQAWMLSPDAGHA